MRNLENLTIFLGYLKELRLQNPLEIVENIKNFNANENNLSIKSLNLIFSN